MTEVLAVAKIRTDGGTQARETLDVVVIAEYAEAMRRGDKFPPLDIYFDNTTYWLADGFHRIKAAEQAAQETIAAIVYHGGQREALLHACGANDTHGLRRSNADKRKAVLTLLQDDEWQKWSDREIARRTRTSPPLVTKTREEYLKTFTDREQSTSTERKVQRGGKTYTMDTGRIGGARTSAAKKATPAERTTRTEGADAKAQPATTRPTLTVVPQREATAPLAAQPGEATPAVAPERETIMSVMSPPTVPLAEVYRGAAEREPVHIPTVPPTPPLMTAWEQANREERQEFVRMYRVPLLELLDATQPAALVPAIEVLPKTQTGIILAAICAATAPLSQEELEQVPGVSVRVLGRNLSRMCASGKLEKLADGRYTAHGESITV